MVKDFWFDDLEAEDGGEVPTIEELTHWVIDGVAEATDGCTVEPDGRCPHGCESWLLALGLI